MADRLLEGIRVVDLTGDAGAMAGRILADLGASVVRVADQEPPISATRADPPADPLRILAWEAGKHTVRPDEIDVAGLLAGADVVLATPGSGDYPESGRAHRLAREAPNAVVVAITPFGLEGPRADWRASDLGVMAASGNLWCTGDPDRPPVRCAEPIAYAHTGPEAAFAALTGLASGRPQVVDLSMQETVLVANMGGVGRWSREQDPGRRRGANIGRTREIWPCADGWVSFGIRGGKARVATWATVTDRCRADGLDVGALEGRDWAAFNHNTAESRELEAISTVVEAWFARHTVRELYTLACDHNLTLAPINSPIEIYASEQLAARGFFGPHGWCERFPRSFVQVRSGDRAMAAVGPVESTEPDAPHGTDASPWSGPRTGGPAVTPASRTATDDRDRPTGAWAGTTIVEFGSGAAGPIATRYFAEHGATVIRVEARSRPDFLRAYALGPKNPHGLDGAPMFDSLNAGKLGITLDLKHPEGRDLAIRLIGHADAVAENFAPKAMAGLGLDYDSLVEHKPDLVMVSACLNGQTGPHRDYPGFGGQGAALAGFNFLTGWPDREPIGPYGTITDSLAPRFVATALAAGLLRHRRTGLGCHLDLSQVEAGTWSLSPWLLRWETAGEVGGRRGNRHEQAAPHGVFPCVGEDRWVAVAVWTDDEWARLAEVIDRNDPSWATSAGRLTHVDEVERRLAAWTSERDRFEVADQLQAAGIEAVPVLDFGDCFADPQLAHRGHLEELHHPRLGDGHYERNGFRLSVTPSAYERPSPLLGEHTDQVLRGLLGLDADEIARLRDAGALD